MTPRIALAAVLLLAPGSALAQAGVTPLAAGPFAHDRGDYEFAGFVTIEEELDLFGVWRNGFAPSKDYGLRAGYTSVFDGGVHFGGDLRYGFSKSPDVPVSFALLAGAQATFASGGSILTFPIGVSIGANVGNPSRPVLLYGLPSLRVQRVDPDGPGSDTQIEFGFELGTSVELVGAFNFEANLTIASNENDNVGLALGLSYRR